VKKIKWFLLGVIASAGLFFLFKQMQPKQENENTAHQANDNYLPDELADPGKTQDRA
jgi:hypothetical protein